MTGLTALGTLPGNPETDGLVVHALEKMAADLRDSRDDAASDRGEADFTGQLTVRDAVHAVVEDRGEAGA